jgi:hypothetical protein
MEADLLPTEIILTATHETMGKIHLDWMPQPGNYLELQGQTYTVLERHHHYKYRVSGYHLSKISLHVQSAPFPTETSLWEGHWVIGDLQCRFNAHSEILRCAVNPIGPCQDCGFFESI